MDKLYIFEVTNIAKDVILNIFTFVMIGVPFDPPIQIVLFLIVELVAVYALLKVYLNQIEYFG